jgi:hypothetical protein
VGVSYLRLKYHLLSEHEKMKARADMAEEDRVWWKRLKRDLRAAICEDQTDLACRLTVEIEIDHLHSKLFPEKHFDFVCSLIRNKSFGRSSAAVQIIHLVMLEWDKLSSGQRHRLLVDLEHTYPKIRRRAWELAFTITEFVGEYYNSESAFEMFLRLAKITNGVPRWFLPHAFEHIAMNSENPNVAAAARNRLGALARDPSSQVRHEVTLSLARFES